MGEYYQWVNVDKKEYISPVDFGYGSKRWQTLHVGNDFLCALYKLLATDWAGDHIIWLGKEEISYIQLIIQRRCIFH